MNLKTTRAFYAATKYALVLTSLVFATFMLSSCYSWFESKVQMDTTSKTATVAKLLSRSSTVEKLDTPSQIFVSKAEYAGSVLISWTEVEYATSYRVEYVEMQPDENGDFSIPAEEDFNILSEYCSETSFMHEILSNPSSSNSEYNYRYYYRVCAQNIGEGIESSDFTEINASKYGTLFAPPTSVDATKGKSHDEVKVSWTEAENAQMYQVWWGQFSDGRDCVLLPNEKIYSSTLYYEDKEAGSHQGTSFYYKVRAVTRNGEYSAFTDLAMGYTIPEGAPDAPTNVQVTNGLGQSNSNNTGLTITWVDTADDTSGGTITYNIYRRSENGAVYSKLNSDGIAQGKQTFTDTSTFTLGVGYYYYLQAVLKKTDDTTISGGFSDSGPDSEDEYGPAYGFLLSPPSTVSVTDGSTDSKAYVVWSPALGYDLDATDYVYNIYSSDTQSGDYSLEVSNVTGTLNSSGYLQCEVDKKNFYKVSTVNLASSNLESELSSGAGPEPNAPSNVTASKTANLSSSYSSSWAYNVNEVYPTLVTWNLPTSGAEPSSYYVYRSTSRTSGYKKLTTSPITDMYYLDTDSTLKPGKFYYYKVVSLNVFSKGSKSNDPSNDEKDSTGWGKSWGYGAITRDQWLREYNKTIMQSQTKMTYMYKSGTDALGTETASGAISGTLYFKSEIAGLGAYITMLYTNYADYYIDDDPTLGVYFLLDGNTNTSCNMNANGNMEGTNKAGTSGMYPGYVIYNNLEIKNGAAGGGYYIVSTKDKSGSVILGEGNVSWLVGEE